jgi:hypothetical protein
VSADGSRSRVELKYGATGDSQHASFEAEDTLEISRRTGLSVSVRELSIPEPATNPYKRGIDRLAKNDPAGSLVHFQRAASEFPTYAMSLAQVNIGHEEEAQLALQKSVDTRYGHYAEPHFRPERAFLQSAKFYWGRADHHSLGQVPSRLTATRLVTIH